MTIATEDTEFTESETNNLPVPTIVSPVSRLCVLCVPARRDTFFCLLPPAFYHRLLSPVPCNLSPVPCNLACPSATSL